MISGVSPCRLVPSTLAPEAEQPFGRVLEADAGGGDQRRVAALLLARLGSAPLFSRKPVQSLVAAVDRDDQRGVALAVAGVDDRRMLVEQLPSPCRRRPSATAEMKS